MPRERHRRGATPRVFMISGVNQKKKNVLGKQIEKLGAVYSKSDNFQNKTTHVVCGKLACTEKFLGALALGRWVVQPEYITACEKAGKWLDEVDYEWSSLDEGCSWQHLAVAAKRNRWRASTSTEKIFTDWQVAVVMSDVKRQNVYKRLLVCGGAKVHDVKLPAKEPLKYSEHVTYLFVDAPIVALTQSLQNCGVMCLKADFISDSIVLHPPPDPLDYIMQVNADNEGGHSSAQESAANESITVGVGEEKTTAGGRTPATAQPSSNSFRPDDDGDGDEKLVMSQCFPSPTSSTKSAGDGLLRTPERPASQKVSSLLRTPERPASQTVSSLLRTPERPASQKVSSLLRTPERPASQKVPSLLRTPECPASQKVSSLLRTPERPASQKVSSLFVTEVGTDDDDVIIVSDDSVSDQPEGRSVTCTTDGDYRNELVPSQRHTVQGRRDGSPQASASVTHGRRKVTQSVTQNRDGIQVVGAQSSKEGDTVKLNPRSPKGRKQFPCPRSRLDNGVEGLQLPPGCALNRSDSCPVVLTSVSSITTATATSTTVRTAVPTTPASPAPSTSSGFNRKKERDKDSFITIENMKQELKKLKSEMTKSPGKQSLVSATSPSRKVQKSLHHWFSPTGKENSEERSQAKEVTANAEGRKQGSGKVQIKTPSKNGRVSDVKRNSVSKQPVPKQKTDVNLPAAFSSKGVPSQRLPESPRSKHSLNLNMLKSQRADVLSGPDLCRSSTSDCSSSVNVLEAPTSRSPAKLCSSEPLTSNCASASNFPSSSSVKETQISDNERDSRERKNETDHLSPKSYPAKKVDITSARTKSSSKCSSSSSDPSHIPSTVVSKKPRVSSDLVLPSVRGTNNRSNFSDDVLSVRSPNKHRSPNKGRSSVRTRIPTARMSSFINTFRKKRTLNDCETEETDQSSADLQSVTVLAERPPVKRRKTIRGLCQKSAVTEVTQNSDAVSDSDKKAEESDIVDLKSQDKLELPSETDKFGNTGSNQTVTSVDLQSATDLTEPSLVKQRKTVRGLCQAASVIEVSQTSDSVSGSDQQAEETPVLKSQASAELRRVAFKPSTTSSPRKATPSSPLKRKLEAGATATKPQTTSSRPRIQGKRWQLSSVSFPSQVDVTNFSTSRLEELTSKTIPNSLSDMVLSSIDENDYHSAVTTAKTVSTQCPSAEMLKHMVTVIKEADKTDAANQAYAVLRSWLDHFPPVTSTLRAIYEEALALQDWEAFRKLIEEAVQESTAGASTEEKSADARAKMVLRFLLAVLEKNFLYFAHNTSKQGRTSCLIIRCLWSPTYEVYPNGRTRQILQFLEAALKHHGGPQACWQELLTLVAMASQCCHLADNKWQWNVGGQVDRCSSTMVSELAHTITGGGVDTVRRLQQVLSCMSPPWLLRQVCAVLLEDYDDYLVPGGLTSDPVTLNKIVSKYFFLLPKLSAQNNRETASPRKKLKKEVELKDENKAPVVDPKLTASKINKKNHKGETMLHRAAIKNSIALLKQALSVPGVEVNAQDNAGWTPLHEACNHGNTECVKALLKFVPSTTLDNFFQSSSRSKYRRVDLHMANEDGITALHDAVNLNRISVVKLLMKYGGSSLLKAKTVEGFTPLDWASTEEMRQVLTRDNMDLSLSQESFSQDLDSQERESVPTAFMYKEVLDNDNTSMQLSATLEETRTLLALLTLMLRSHLHVRKQEQQEQRQHQERQPEDAGESDVGDVKFHAKCLRRHIQKITTKEVYTSVTLQLGIVEALLMQCR